MSKLREYARLMHLFASVGLLAWMWLAVMQQFAGAMLPRLNHLGAAGLRISDRPCECPQCDFSGFWPAGLLARAHRLNDLFDPVAFLAFRHQVFSPAAELVRWYYPPTALLPVTAISYLPFEAAFWVWSGCFTLACVLLLRWGGVSAVVITASLLSPAALWNFELGQFGIVMGGVLAAGLLLAQRLPLAGGAVLGLLVFKPQYGILVPFALLARGRWRAIAACGVVAAGIIGLVLLLFGTAVWGIYLKVGAEVSRQVLELAPNGFNSEKFGVSVFWMVRSFGAGMKLAYLLQILGTAMVAIGVWAVWRNQRWDAVTRMALTVFLSLLATPYGYTDDMVAWSVALAALAERRGWRIGLLDVLFWLWPMLCPIITARTGLLFTPVIIALALGRTMWETSYRTRQNATA
jgi:alpha-1,2-mannosyltransferase